LIFVDGGKGHVNAVSKALESLNVNIPIFGIVKDNKHRTRAIAATGSEITIAENRAVFELVTKIQDEMHRFAISFNRSKHAKNSFSLGLTEIKGIGSKKALALLTHFKTREGLLKANAEEIAEVAKVNAETAKAVFGFLHSQAL
jgi:excinuclease ABC subunit C